MGSLNAFTTAWTSARATFGEGTPVDGTRLSGETVRNGTDLAISATPSSDWTGAGSGAYETANRAHIARMNTLAGIDRRFGVEIGRSAEVIGSGRRDLDAVRRWVADAAGTLPNNAAGQQMLWSIVSRGVGDLQTIVTQTQSRQSEIAERIRALGDEYAMLGTGGVHGTDGIALDTPEPAPETSGTVLDLDDVVYLDPAELGPPNHIEIGPGVWIPNYNRPGVAPSPAKAPLDYRDIVYSGPKGKSPGRGYTELVPGSGAWVPDPNSAGFVPHPPEVAVDMSTAVILGDGDLAPAGMIPIYPGARIAIPNPDLGRPH